VTKVGEYWISPTNEDIRPYGFCVKEIWFLFASSNIGANTNSLNRTNQRAIILFGLQ
jgi:hypothetical protein